MRKLKASAICFSLYVTGQLMFGPGFFLGG